jgi:hypothetical protein
MPGGDRTGPLGQGPRTGRAAGFCADFEIPGYVNPGFSYRFGYGGGRGFRGGAGRGWRHRYYATGLPGWARPDRDYAPAWSWGHPSAQSHMAPFDELKFLRSEAGRCEKALQEIRARIEEVERKREEMRKE